MNLPALTPPPDDLPVGVRVAYSVLSHALDGWLAGKSSGDALSVAGLLRGRLDEIELHALRADRAAEGGVS